MKLVCDTNILLDVILRRDPFYSSSVQALHMIEDGEIEGIIPVTSLTDIFYIVRKLSQSGEKAYRALELTRRILKVCSVTTEEEERAFERRVKDYEDSLLSAVGESNECDYVLTRNISDFETFPLKAITPDELLDKFMI